MTNQQANAEAMRLWGPTGEAWHAYDIRPEYWCSVGCWDEHDGRTLKGHGRTWEEAFANADEVK
jgi:hypothetical protein